MAAVVVVVVSNASAWVDRPATFTVVQVSGSCPEASSSSYNLVAPGSASNISPAVVGLSPGPQAPGCHDISLLGDLAALIISTPAARHMQ